jgi:hypothetical protein
MLKIAAAPFGVIDSATQHGTRDHVLSGCGLALRAGVIAADYLARLEVA